MVEKMMLLKLTSIYQYILIVVLVMIITSFTQAVAQEQSIAGLLGWAV